MSNNKKKVNKSVFKVDFKEGEVDVNIIPPQLRTFKGYFTNMYGGPDRGFAVQNFVDFTKEEIGYENEEEYYKGLVNRGENVIKNISGDMLKVFEIHDVEYFKKKSKELFHGELYKKGKGILGGLFGGAVASVIVVCVVATGGLAAIPITAGYGLAIVGTGSVAGGLTALSFGCKSFGSGARFGAVAGGVTSAILIGQQHVNWDGKYVKWMKDIVEALKDMEKWKQVLAGGVFSVGEIILSCGLTIYARNEILRKLYTALLLYLAQKEPEHVCALSMKIIQEPVCLIAELEDGTPVKTFLEMSVWEKYAKSFIKEEQPIKHPLYKGIVVADIFSGKSNFGNNERNVFGAGGISFFKDYKKKMGKIAIDFFLDTVVSFDEASKINMK